MLSVIFCYLYCFGSLIEQPDSFMSGAALFAQRFHYYFTMVCWLLFLIYAPNYYDQDSLIDEWNGEHDVM